MAASAAPDGSLGHDFGTAKNLVELLPFPGESPRQHEGVQWWESTHTRFAAAGLVTTAKGGIPPAAERIIDVPLDSIPDLPSDDPGYHRRRELRIRTQTQNAVNERLRYSLIMGGRTTVFASIYKSVESVAPMFSRELIEACDYSLHGIEGGYFDGSLAYRMAQAKLFAGERTKADREFYRSAESLQRSSRLPDGCKPSEYMKKAYAFIYKIRPHLAQQYSDEDAADYVVDMVPKRLAADARRIKAECQRNGTFTNLMHLARELEKVIFEDQSSPPVPPALVSVGADIAGKFDLLALSDMCGMALTTSDKAGKTELGLVGADGTTKWCPRCPHNNGVCFSDPAFEGPFPPSIQDNAERRKAFLQAQAANAKKAGVTNKRIIHFPSQQEIDEWRARPKGRGRGRGRGGGRGGGRGANAGAAGVAKGADEQPVGGGAAVDTGSFYDNLRDISDVGLCGACVSSAPDVGFCVADASTADADGASDAGELQWFVVCNVAGELSLRGAVDPSFLELESEATCVGFGSDEQRARRYLATKRAGAGAAEPTTSAAALRGTHSSHAPQAHRSRSAADQTPVVLRDVPALTYGSAAPRDSL